MRDSLRRLIGRLYARSFTHATWCEGHLKSTGAPVRCLLAMTADESQQNDLLRRLLGDSARRLRRRRIAVAWLRHLLARPPAGLDFCIAMLPPVLDASRKGPHDLKSPAWVRQVLDITGEWADVKKRLRRMQRVIVNRLDTRDPYELVPAAGETELEHFYHRMYVPHCRRHFQDAAQLDSFEFMRTQFRAGFLMLLKEDGVAIAGGLCSVRGDTMYYNRVGVLDGADEHLAKGAQGALYYHLIRLARERGLRRFDLIDSRPFLNDGVYRHKRGWGASVAVDPEQDAWLYFFNLGSPGAALAALRDEPMVVDTPQGLMVYLVRHPGLDVGPQDAVELGKRYHSAGLQGVLFAEDPARPPLAVAFGAAAGAD
jgi:hypothetical protein